MFSIYPLSDMHFFGSLHPYHGRRCRRRSLSDFFEEPMQTDLMSYDPLASMLDAWTLIGPYWRRPRPCPDSEQKRGVSEVRNEADKFSISLDVSQFRPEDLKVKTVENVVVIQGSHDEQVADHGFVSRSFTRKYMLPKEVDPTTVVSTLNADGLLCVEAPKMAIEAGPVEHSVTIQEPVAAADKEAKNSK